MPRQSRQFRTPPDYVPKHRIPDGWAGSTPRGPHRWARAAHNALIRPNSQDARLYQKRVRLAVEYRDVMETVVGKNSAPIIFLKWQGGRDYVVCSHYCAAMQAQLDRGSTTMGGIMHALGEHNTLVEHDPDIFRAMRCQCCGSTVRP